jgi:hypothetical protein
MARDSKEKVLGGGRFPVSGNVAETMKRKRCLKGKVDKTELMLRTSTTDCLWVRFR